MHSSSLVLLLIVQKASAAPTTKTFSKPQPQPQDKNLHLPDHPSLRSFGSSSRRSTLSVPFTSLSTTSYAAAKPTGSSKNKGDIATMRLITASLALFVALALALPYDLRARQVSVEEPAMTNGNGEIVPYDAAGVST
ncbi:hypothetical protein XANCAGTX0491_006211 [Xanthoria calcicola]